MHQGDRTAPGREGRMKDAGKAFFRARRKRGFWGKRKVTSVVLFLRQ